MSKKFNDVCRKVGSEGTVLLKNDENVLPIAKGTVVSVFGRMQNHYIKSGLGSGGLVNVEYVVDIPEGLGNAGLIMNTELAEFYAEWEKEHPYDEGKGWTVVPWSQVEMPLSDSLVKKASEKSEIALVIIGRTAGEERDNHAEQGSYLLSHGEEDMIKKVTSYFEKVVVLFNTGNIMDMKWVKTYNPSAVLYTWQGGQEGGNAIADVLVGDATPSGKLTDTIACDITDYPAYDNFGNMDTNYYCEDIYVGYRYFNTFAKDRVIYPFGFGLSYTTFEYTCDSVERNEEKVVVKLIVKNSGSRSGKEIVQVYLSAPQGELGKPERTLVAYKKTKLLLPGESEHIVIEFNLHDAASFDDTGVTGHESCFVLEKGNYVVHISKDAMTDIDTYSFEIIEDIVVQKCSKAMEPEEDFRRIRPVIENGEYIVSYEKIWGETAEVRDKISQNIPTMLEYTGDKGIKLIDVRDGKNTMEEFVAQFTDEDLACISFGEGMDSPKVTGGTGCAFGGITKGLMGKGVPIACGTDGPSGLRMDFGAKATSMPNGTLLACTWNEELLEELFECEGQEMAVNNIDVLLGPGMNIHRHPLCGRNFEYLSEDPLVSGRIAYAICKGLANTGASGTIKHFCGNNQETNRHNLNSVISQRALREIYLKPFEIVVKLGEACKAIMTSYNPVNGCWTAGNYDLTTTILRDEWGYTGFVMSDWWARTAKESFERKHGVHNPEGRDYVPCVEAQNDIYMCCENIDDFKNFNLYESIQRDGVIRGQVQRNAMNICRYLMHSNAMERFQAKSIEENLKLLGSIQAGELVWEIENVLPDKKYEFNCKKTGTYVLEADIISRGSALSQNTLYIYAGDEYISSFTVKGSDGEVLENVKRVHISQESKYIHVKYPQEALSIVKISISKEK